MLMEGSQRSCFKYIIQKSWVYSVMLVTKSELMWEVAIVLSASKYKYQYYNLMSYLWGIAGDMPIHLNHPVLNFSFLLRLSLSNLWCNVWGCRLFFSNRLTFILSLIYYKFCAISDNFIIKAVNIYNFFKSFNIFLHFITIWKVVQSAGLGFFIWFLMSFTISTEGILVWLISFYLANLIKF